MKFWDTCAIVALMTDETGSRRVEEEYHVDPGQIVWCMTPTEIWSALARRRRESVLDSVQLRRARKLLKHLASDWTEIDDVQAVRDRAMRAVEVHPLTAADAVQLGAALVAARDQPSGFEFVTLDGRLAEAAEREGFDLAITPESL